MKGRSTSTGKRYRKYLGKKTASAFGGANRFSGAGEKVYVTQRGKAPTHSL